MDTRLNNSSFVTTDGVRLHVLEAGPQGNATSPVIAFVPGWSMPATVWREQLVALGTLHRVAALDPRGQGESEIPGGGYIIERRAADVSEFIARYSRVVLVGWSLGALEALECVHRYGDTALEALVLVDSSVGEDPAPPSAAAFIDALRCDRRAAIDIFMREIFGSTCDAAEIATLTAAALRMPLEASLSLFPGAVPRTHWRDIARAFRKPLLYAVGAGLAGQAQSLQRQRPATRIEIFENAGHALFVDEAARFNALLAGFVAAIADKV